MVTTKYCLGTVISFNPDHSFGFIRDRFDGHQAHFRMSAARHFTLMGGVLIHYVDRSVSIPKPEKGDLVIFQEKSPKREDLKSEVTVFFYALPAIEVMRNDWIYKHDRCACEHLFSDHQNLGTWCTKCECGHELAEDINFNEPLTDFIDPAGSSEPNGRNMIVLRPGEIPDRDQSGDWYDKNY